MAILLDGKKLAGKIKEEILREVESLKKRYSKTPVLASVVVGEGSASSLYIKHQTKLAAEVGIKHRLIALKKGITQEGLISQIKQLNADKDVHGVIISRPLPEGISFNELIGFLSPQKDAEGMHPENLGRLLLGEDRVAPCTAKGCMELLKAYEIKPYGKDVVIVGHSEIVGKPLSLMFLKEFATTTACHIATSEANRLSSHVQRADILIVAVGKTGLIKGPWIKQGAVVVDVGINKVGEQIVGDVEFDGAEKKASYITPVPGGVGPLTVVMLMKNCVELFKQAQEN